MIRILLLAPFALSACAMGEAVVQETTRSLARSAVEGATAQYLPGVDVSPFTDCVINNAGTSELIQLANAASKGTNGAAEAWPVVRGVVSRPEARQCLISSISTLQLAGAAGLMR